jgi:DNA-binding response OmpR family regulator
MPGKVLIVEDDPALVHAIIRNLSVRGYATESAMTVADAVAAVDSSCPAVLLLDIDLPDGSGWEVVRALRANGCGDTPVIVISALRPNARLAKELRCAAVLEKPFPMDSLLRLVIQSLDGLEGQRSREAAISEEEST